MQSPVPSVILAHFLRQIESHHCRTPNEAALPLHYDSATQSLTVFLWPSELGSATPVAPSMLESFRRTHEFRGPCCLFALLESKDYTECRIGVVERAEQHSGETVLPVVNGEYVAVCARQRCGYVVCLERFYALPELRLQACRRRDVPLLPQELTHFSDFRKLARPVDDGLFQMMPVIRARGRQRLPMANPRTAEVRREGIIRDLMHGMQEDRFWMTFIQCLICKAVLFRECMPGFHHCLTEEEWGRGDQHSAISKHGDFAVHLERSQGDTPEESLLKSLRSSPSPTPTEMML